MTREPTMDAARVEIATSAQIGESPIWDEEQGILWWVDSLAPALHRYQVATGEDEQRPLPAEVGSVALTAGGDLLLALADGCYRYNWHSERLNLVARVAGEPAENRFNDGRVDRAGRFWVGTMAPYGAGATGSLYRLNLTGTAQAPGAQPASLQAMAHGFALSNTLCWNLAGTVMYHSDTMTGLVWRREMNEDGSIGVAEAFLDFRDRPGLPDGAIVDAEDHLWIAHYGGGRVTRFDPYGDAVEERILPTLYATCPTLGGPDMCTLFVTTAGTGALAEGIADPDFGALYSFGVTVPGLPEVRVANL